MKCPQKFRFFNIYPIFRQKTDFFKKWDFGAKLTPQVVVPDPSNGDDEFAPTQELSFETKLSSLAQLGKEI